MALLNEILVGRYNRLAQKLLSMKGPAALPQLAGEIRFALPLFHGAENRYLEAWDLFGVTRANAAPSAGTSTFTLRNPAGSNVLAVVTRAAITEATASTAVAGGQILTVFRPGSSGAGGGDENTVIPTQGWDGRGRPASSLIVSTNTAAQVGRVGGIGIFTVGGAANSFNEWLRPGEEIPMSPGTLITLSAVAVTEATIMSVWWRERFLEDSERT